MDTEKELAERIKAVIASMPTDIDDNKVKNLSRPVFGLETPMFGEIHHGKSTFVNYLLKQYINNN